MEEPLNSDADTKGEELPGRVVNPEQSGGTTDGSTEPAVETSPDFKVLFERLQERTTKIEADLSKDITRRERGEEEIRQLNATLEDRVAARTRQLSDANANLQVFSNTAAHDLRSPLRTISGFAEALLEEYGNKLDPTGTFYLQRISRSAEHMTRLLEDLLEYSRTTQAELQLGSVDLGEAVQAALALTEPVVASEAEISVEKPFPPVIGHRATVVMIINNLIANALKFVAPGVKPRVHIRPEREGAHVRLWVEDNGIGIDPKDIGKLFDPFQRLHSRDEYPGTGLGLALVRRGAERMAGRLGVKANPGGGSRFWIDLPSAA